MTLAALRMSFADRAALESELETNLKLGRAFVHAGQGIEVLADCTLVIVHPDDGGEFTLTGQAVFISDAGAMAGVGVQLRPFDAEVVGALEAFVRGERASAAATATPVAEAARESGAGTETETESERESETETEAAPHAGGDEADSEGSGEPDEDRVVAGDVQKQQARHERLRYLNQTQQQKLARTGDLQDRVMLERLYGKGVWDNLLHNPKLTLPEVARMARMGTMPRPLLELMVENNTWIQAPIVRRALLGNPRLSGEAIMKLLRITPKHELKVIHKTTTYSSQVREAARKVLDL